MAVEIKVPSVGESITEVFIGEWYLKPGDWVEVDGNIVGLETDKATFDVPAPQAGVITKILKAAGSTATIGEAIALLEPGPAPAGKSSGGSSAASPAASTKTTPTGGKGEAVVMPAAARVAGQHGVDAGQVAATGPGGRVLKEDVQRHLQGGGDGIGTAREVRRVPMSPMRQTIARRLVEAQQTAALLTTFNECDMSAIKRLRAEYQDAFVARHGVKL
ncbi:MAG: E3 binding domain-containing protein, partial [Planctomycetaceae bacterium]|nr:E3 binding domain-containing protein [Planctomycetaceae bacterium]